MDTTVNAFDLSAEQQDTVVLLQRLLGKAIADRYIDFCRLAAGAFELHVARPVAAHALRELDSTLRTVLEVPMDARAKESQADVEKIADAKKQLRVLGFDNDAIQRAEKALKPRFSHKTQIRKIVQTLGLSPDGDVAKCWTSLCDSFGRAHQRSFHHSLKVDDEFRTEFQRPFDTVVRAVAIALQGRYVALMRRVEELAAMVNLAQAVSLFAQEIPGALPLQWHFFQRLQTGDWLPHLAREKLLDEPLADATEGASDGMRHRQWPAGNYLLRMAESSDAKTRVGVVDALKNVSSSKHLDIQHDGLEILAALPADESAQLTDMAVAWLGREARFSFLQAPDQLVKKLADGNQCEAALKVARALLQVWDNNGELASLHGHHMYQHHLPSIAAALDKACGLDALRLFVDLLKQAADISGQSRYGYHSSRPIASDEMANNNIHDALLSAVRRSAQSIVANTPALMHEVMDVLLDGKSKTLVRVALHVLSKNPATASGLAEKHLTDPELIEATWCKHEYASLALSWFPSLDSEKQQAILATVDAIPDKYRAIWVARVTEQSKEPPTAEQDRKFVAATIRDTLWRWRTVLPPERQAALEMTVGELGDPDAWRTQMFPPEVSPMAATEFSSQPIFETVAFLKTWHPKAELRVQTVTALGQELRTAVSNDPKRFAAEADLFIGLRPIYIRRLLEGLQNATGNERDIQWDAVLKLVEHVFANLNRTIDSANIAEGDDKNWLWACTTAGELIAAGLRRGKGGPSFQHAKAIRSLVLSLVDVVPRQLEIEDFEERFQREPFFAAQATMRGVAIELCILLIFWLTKDPTGDLGAEPRSAIADFPEMKAVFEAQLDDRTPSGRVPRAIMGRYLHMLCYFGETWLKSKIRLLLPSDNEALRRATWLSFLGFGQGPIADLMPDLEQCYAEEIARTAQANEQADRDFHQESLADHLLILYLWNTLPDNLLEQFWRESPVRVRQHAVWFLGTQLALPDLPDDARKRGLAYWERRVEAAKAASDPDLFRLEVGAIGHLCIHGQVADVWLLEQLSSLLAAGFVPTDAFSVVDWLHKISKQHVDKSVAVLSALLMNPRIDKWAYMTQREPIRAILSAGFSEGSPETAARAQELIGFLSTIGETSYLDLVPSSAA